MDFPLVTTPLVWAKNCADEQYRANLLMQMPTTDYNGPLQLLISCQIWDISGATTIQDFTIGSYTPLLWLTTNERATDLLVWSWIISTWFNYYVIYKIYSFRMTSRLNDNAIQFDKL